MGCAKSPRCQMNKTSNIFVLAGLFGLAAVATCRALPNPAAAYAGIRAPAGFAAAGRPLAVGLIAVSPEGAPLSGLPITLTACPWKSVFRTMPVRSITS